MAKDVRSHRQGLRLCLVVSRFNAPVTERLERGARRALEAGGVDPAKIDVYHVPGAWELPLGAHLALQSVDYDGVVALGCVIRGETPHFDYVCLGATTGLEALSRERGVPVGFGLLTTDTPDQAFARAAGEKGDKGQEAAAAVLEMCDLAARLR